MGVLVSVYQSRKALTSANINDNRCSSSVFVDW
jgi:hypothetical protein